MPVCLTQPLLPRPCTAHAATPPRTCLWSSSAAGGGCTDWPLRLLRCWRSVRLTVGSARGAAGSAGVVPSRGRMLARCRAPGMYPCKSAPGMNVCEPQSLPLAPHPPPLRPPVHPCAGLVGLPDSPRWLLLSGAGPAAATAALKQAKGRAADDAAVQVGRGGGSAGIAREPRTRHDTAAAAGRGACAGPAAGPLLPCAADARLLPPPFACRVSLAVQAEVDGILEAMAASPARQSNGGGAFGA